MVRSILFILIMTAFSAESYIFSGQKNSGSLPLIPVPFSVISTNEAFRLDSSFSVSLIGPTSRRLISSVERFLQRLSDRTAQTFTNNFTNENRNSEFLSMVINCAGSAELGLTADESYELKISFAEITLDSKTDLGTLYGIETLLQLLDSDSSGYFFHGAEIKDKPRFPWRGLLLDAARHFIPVDVIKRNMDAMCSVKMNVLHWHLSDDQGFRVECKTFPKLHQMGSGGLYYSQEQIKEIINYADLKGIRIIPEFDVPGHTTSWFAGYPELASAEGPYAVSKKFGVHDACMNPAKEETYEFLNLFIEEMAQLFPDEYFHIGGDEVTGEHWNINSQIQEFMRKENIINNDELQRYFNSKVFDILEKYGKRMIGWDEILQPDLPKTIICEAWRDPGYIANTLRRGFRVIRANGYYIDLMQSAEFHYLNDPLPDDSSFTDEERKLVLGGEAAMWGELVTAENIDSRIWPRTAAIAERFWSPAHYRDADDMYSRLERISLRLEELGIAHKKNPDMMLRRIANTENIKSLKILIDALEPVEQYERQSLYSYSTFTPLTRMVDIAAAEAQAARKFRKLVGEFLNSSELNQPLLNEIKRMLKEWSDNHKEVINICKQSPALKEIEIVSENLSYAASVGLETLKFFEKENPSKGWIEEKLNIIEKLKGPKAEMEIRILPAVEALILKLQKHVK